MNPFVVTLIVLDVLAGFWYIKHNQLDMGLLWLTYGLGNIFLLRLAE